MRNKSTLSDQDLVRNPTSRVPIILCLDTSGSMEGDPIRELGEGVTLFYESIFEDEIARYSAEIGIVTFGYDGVQRVADFASLEIIREKPSLHREFQAGGRTPMGEAVCEALDMLENRKRMYQNAGVDYFQPWLVLMTDGIPTDDIHMAVERIGGMVQARKLAVFSIGIGGEADMDTLHKFSPNRPPLRLRGLEFKKFFEWLSASVQRVSASTPGQTVDLDKDAINAWGTV